MRGCSLSFLQLGVPPLTPRPSPAAGPLPIVRRMKTWMRRRGDRVKITSGQYTSHTGTIESNVHQRTVDYPDEWHNGFHVMLGHGEAGDGAVEPVASRR